MYKILIVDDDDDVRTMLGLTLESAGYEVQEAQNGNEALKLYKEHPADLVITDIVMPDKEGLELIMEFRRYDPEVKIIAISGGGRGSLKNYLDTAKKFGAQATLAKPFTKSELLEAIHSVSNQ